MNLKYKNQSGRSMVEMLGTLAIIGVLSIGGIAGYSYGMDKYRANQTINDIMLRAVDLMTQASRGREVLSLDEWNKESSVYDFSNPAYSDDELGLIMFDVGANNKIPQRVCEMIYDGLSNSTIQIDINERVSDSKNDCSSDNTMTFYFEGGTISRECTSKCKENEYCDNGKCYAGTPPELSKGLDKICTSTSDCNVGHTGECSQCWNNKCIVLSEQNNTSCTLSGGIEGQCYAGECLPKSGCTSNNGCNSGEYCVPPKVYGCVAFPDNQTGICASTDGIFKGYEINGELYFVSNVLMNYWETEAACAAEGKEMLSIDDLFVSGTLTDLAQQLKTVISYEPAVWVKGPNGCTTEIVDLDWERVLSDYSKSEVGGGTLGNIAVCKNK